MAVVIAALRSVAAVLGLLAENLHQRRLEKVSRQRDADEGVVHRVREAFDNAAKPRTVSQMLTDGQLRWVAYFTERRRRAV